MGLKAFIFGRAPVQPSVMSFIAVWLFIAGALFSTARPDSEWWALLMLSFGGAGTYRIIFIEVMNRR